MKKILFLIQSETMPSSRVRVLDLLAKLQKKNFEITCIKYPKKFSEKMLFFRSLGHFDAVYLQKRLISPVDSFIIGRLSRKFIYDFDDAVYLRHESHKKKKPSFSSMIKFKSILKNTDTVVAGNRVLADFAAKFTGSVEIIPSTVETDNIPVRDYSSKNEKFIVGWVGGNINLSQLQLLAAVLKRLSGEIPLELRVISGEAPDIPGVDVVFIPWAKDTQETEIAKFDAGLMPLPDSPHARGKCAFKAIQYMASGVVPVVSDVGINAEVVQDGRCGLVAENIDDFYNKIKFLYENPEKRAEMGKRARERIVNNYSVDNAVKMMENLLS